ncbi:MAG: exodeoxyribonuclease III [Bacteroidia bacterium]|nr:exodeoxyribonuclease III [Bacteroidia bacterium]
MKNIISYNVNGIRAAVNKGFLDWLIQESPDIICLQETKAQPDQLDPALLNPEGYHAYWYSAEKKGYSGVAILSKEKPLHVEYGCGLEKYDQEGRVIRADFKDYSVISVYFPSGSSGDERQEVKEEFLEDFYTYIQELKKSYPNLIVSGDYNICHQPIDIHNPVSNKNSSGFLPHEREWVTKLLNSGFVDSFRKIYPTVEGRYSWWTFRFNARKNNKGWRIDYHMLTSPLEGKCVGADILSDIEHSDHCPIKVVMDL